jgi:hypothetical protein
VVPKFGVGTSSADEAKEAAPLVQSTVEPIVVPKVPTVEPVKTRVDRAEEPKIEKIMKMPEILSPPTKAKLPKVQKASATTPKEEDGQRVGCCAGDYEGLEPCSYKESC